MDHPAPSNSEHAAPARHHPSLSRRLRLPATVALGLAVGLAALFALERSAEATRLLEAAHITVPLGLPETPSETAVAPAPAWQTVTIESGDSLATIFDQVGLRPDVLSAVVHSGDDAQQLQRLIPGETLRFDIQAGQLKQLRYEMDRLHTLEVTHSDQGFTSALEVKSPEVRVAHASGVIDSSLFNAGLRAGLSEPLIMQMAEVFGWDIDFSLDIRQGDRFSVLYEEHYVDGEKFGTGNILAAEFINDGRTVQAVKYTDPTGRSDYYSADGHSMRKAFLRSPVDFRRISSRFQRERFHPVLGVKRPHQGVDYSAAVGTPIKAAGDGKVIFAGVKGGYGKVVVLQHGGAYSTLYGHMSRFNKTTRVGSRVRQGQVIGYVGQTGVATGPHLHYEFRVNGVHRNPLTVKLPDAAPISAAYKADFEAHMAGMLARLNAYDQVQVATSEP